MSKVKVSNTLIPKGSIQAGDGTKQRADCLVGANGKVLTADDTKPCGLDWKTPSGGGGVNIVQTVLNFGYPPSKTRLFNVIDASISPSSKIMASNGNNDTDINDESFDYNINVRTGSFDITITGETRIGGLYKLNYIIQ